VLAFVTSLPHPVNCVSYRRRSLLLSATLRSILRQTDADIRVIVVANEPPEGDLPDDRRVEVAEVAFPPSTSPAGRPSAVHGIYDDKGAKLGLGTAVALRRGASHVMYVDSDDYVHRGIAGFVTRSPDAAGWYSDAGFFHVRGERTVTAVAHGFHQRNGSTHIVRTDLVGVPEDLDAGMARDEVLERIGRERAGAILGRHRPVVAFFRDRGTPLAPLPFPGAIWEIGTGENFSRVLAAAGERLPVDGRISDDFGLAVPGHVTACVSALASLRSRAVRRVTRRRGEPVQELAPEP
jgi:hypothetical protein